MKAKFLLLMFSLGFIGMSLKAQTPIENYSRYVDKFTGDFHYSIPLMSVQGKHGENVPISINYNAGIRVNQDAGPIGLGWSMPLGEITRQVNGVPDDWYNVQVTEKEMNHSFYLFNGVTNEFNENLSIQGQETNHYWGALYLKDFNENQADCKMDLAHSTLSSIGTIETPAYDSYYASGPGIGGEFRGYMFEYASLYNQPHTPSSGDSYTDNGGNVSEYTKFTKDLEFRFRNEPQSITYNGNIVASLGGNVVQYEGSIWGGTGYSQVYKPVVNGNKVLIMTKSLSDYLSVGYTSEHIHTVNMNGQDIIPSDVVYEKGGTDLGISFEEFKDFYRKLAIPTTHPLDSEFSGLGYTDQMQYYLPKWKSRAVAGVTTRPDELAGEVFHAQNIGNFQQNSPSGSVIEYFTNEQIEAGVTGFIESSSIESDYRDNLNPKHIGAFRITLANGICYHYSLPVYESKKRVETHRDHNEAFTGNFAPYQSGYSIWEEPYVVSWKLTAVTGPDYEDVTNPNNEVNIVNYGDKGFWIAYDYTKLTEKFATRVPYSEPDESPKYTYGISYQAYEPDKSYEDGYRDIRSFITSTREQWVIEYIQTSQQTAVFTKSARHDGHSLPFKESTDEVHSTGDRLPQLKFDKILLLRTEEFTESWLNSLKGSSINSSQYTGISTSLYDPQYIQTPTTTGYDYGQILKEVNFDSDYHLADALYNSINNEGKLALNKLEIKLNGESFLKDYEFAYAENPDYNHDKQDYFGFYNHSYTTPTDNRYSDGQKVNAWSLSQIKEPKGTILDIEYENDDFLNVANYNNGYLHRGYYASGHNPSNDIYYNVHWVKEENPVIGGGLRVRRLEVTTPIYGGRFRNNTLQYNYGQGTVLNNPYEMLSLHILKKRVLPNNTKSSLFNAPNRVGYASVYEYVKGVEGGSEQSLGYTKYTFRVTSLDEAAPNNGFLNGHMNISSIHTVGAATSGTLQCFHSVLNVELGAFGLPTSIQKSNNTYKKVISYERQRAVNEHFYKCKINNGREEAYFNTLREITYTPKTIAEYVDNVHVSTVNNVARDKYTGMVISKFITQGNITKEHSVDLAYENLPLWGPKWNDLTKQNRLSIPESQIQKRYGQTLSGQENVFEQVNRVLHRNSFPFTINTTSDDKNYLAKKTKTTQGGGVWIETNEVTMLNADRKVIESKGPNNVYSARKYDLFNENIIAEAANSNYFSFTHSSFERDKIISTNDKIIEGDLVVLAADIPKVNLYYSDHMGVDPRLPEINAHTGSRYAGIAANQTVSLYKVSSIGTKGILPNKRYKASVWVHRNSGASDIEVAIGSTIINGAETIAYAGLWDLKVLYFDVPDVIADFEIRIKNNSVSKELYIDDLDFHAVDATTSYTIYSGRNALPIYTIDKSNHYVRMVYDNANRVIETYKEYKGVEKQIEAIEYHPYGFNNNQN